MDSKLFDLNQIEVFLYSGLSSHEGSKTNFYAKGANRVLVYKSNLIECLDATGTRIIKSDIWAALNEFVATAKTKVFGYLGYDLKNEIEVLESLNKDEVGAPDLFFFEPQELHFWSVNEKPPLDLSFFFNHDEAKEYWVNPISEGCSKADYLQKVEQIKDLIHEGDFYELNFSRMQQFQIEGVEGKELFSRMSQVGPVPFSAYMNLGNGIELISMSPERFLKREANRLISQPIKGTIRRSENTEQDQQFMQQLLNSEKERAENLMIVDLVRNDLNRVAIKGSESVISLFEIQAFKTVFQMVSTIQAEIKPNMSLSEILKACFPMGSMTGAPKVNVMKWIEKLENYKRGIYSGALGFIDPCEEFDFNVVIRTAILKNGVVYYATGGAITADSIAEQEWNETILKTAALQKIFKKGVK